MYSNKKDCPVKTCTLMKSKNCETELSQPNPYLTKDIKDPFPILALDNIEAGYTQYFCYNCTVDPVGGAKSFSFVNDEIKITQ